MEEIEKQACVCAGSDAIYGCGAGIYGCGADINGGADCTARGRDVGAGAEGGGRPGPSTMRLGVSS